MNLGRFELGQELVVPLLCTDGAGVAVVPDAPPAIMVYNPAGTKVVSDRMACRDRYGATGMFLYRTPLNANFGVGRYGVVVTWKASGVARLRALYFETVPGGDAAGAVVSQYFLERPQANYLVQKTDGGVRVFGRNPRL